MLVKALYPMAGVVSYRIGFFLKAVYVLCRQCCLQRWLVLVEVIPEGYFGAKNGMNAGGSHLVLDFVGGVDIIGIVGQ